LINIGDFDLIDEFLSAIALNPIIWLIFNMDDELLGIRLQILGDSLEILNGDTSTEFLFIEIIKVHCCEDKVPLL